MSTQSLSQRTLWIIRQDVYTESLAEDSVVNKALNGQFLLNIFS